MAYMYCVSDCSGGAANCSVGPGNPYGLVVARIDREAKLAANSLGTQCTAKNWDRNACNHFLSRFLVCVTQSRIGRTAYPPIVIPHDDNVSSISRARGATCPPEKSGINGSALVNSWPNRWSILATRSPRVEWDERTKLSAYVS